MHGIKILSHTSHKFEIIIAIEVRKEWKIIGFGSFAFLIAMKREYIKIFSLTRTFLATI